MEYKNIFKRYEMKYIITAGQYEQLRGLLQKHAEPDEYGVSTIRSVYYDTPDFRLIRRSMEKPFYKEKLRLRGYETARAASTVFVELKKKYDSVVYKRRISVPFGRAEELLTCGGESQIAREIRYFTEFYDFLAPSVFLSYDRLAFADKSDSSFRITIDRNILWRDWDLSLSKGVGGYPVLNDGLILMELKTPFALPLWMTGFLCENKIYKTSFSKYAKAYLSIAANKNIGESA